MFSEQIYFLLAVMLFSGVTCVCDNDDLKCFNDFDKVSGVVQEKASSDNVVISNPDIKAIGIPGEGDSSSNETLGDSGALDDINLSGVWSQITNIFRGIIEERSEIEREFETQKTVDENTKIHVKAFDLGVIKNKNSKTSSLETENSTKVGTATTKPTILTTTTTTTLPNNNTQNEVLKYSESFADNERDNEILHVEFPLNIDYDIEDDNTTDYPIIDYVELYKDTTNEYVDVTEGPVTDDYDLTERGQNNTENELENFIEGSMKQGMESSSNTSSAAPILPWIATIFIKSVDSDQYNYYCDGAILSETVILTAARCVNTPNQINVIDILVILGKTSLQSSGPTETIHKVKQIKPHENFTNDHFIQNDLAVLVLEDAATFSDSIGAASIDCFEKENVGTAVTTAWDVSGELKTIVFEKTRHRDCKESSELTFCATFGDQIALCPNYGGIYAGKLTSNDWCLLGLRTADPTNRGVCVEKTVAYTSLDKYMEWIVNSFGK